MTAKIENHKLVRALGPVDATMIVMGSMIGSGIFITSAESARLIGAPGWLLLAWAVAGLMTITGALCCLELATMMPRAGGVYVFLREAYGSSIGFLYGWTLFLVIQTGTIAAVAIAFAEFLGERLEPSDRAAWFCPYWWVSPGVAFRKVDGRPALCSDGLDKRDLRWKRGSRSWKKSGARHAVWLRNRCDSLSPRESRLHRSFAVFR